jgi:hypothetical protein
MDTTYWIIVAVVAVLVLVIYSYRREIGLDFKGWGFQAKLRAKGAAESANPPPGSRNVSIGGDATDNQIVTGDSTTSKKAAVSAGRNVSIGGSAAGNTIVTGDDNKVG